ncbi:hypothetical protein QSE84_005186, partial [Escherichia coli]
HRVISHQLEAMTPTVTIFLSEHHGRRKSGFFVGTPGGGACPRGGSARKKAHFCDFIVIIIMSVIYCF